MVIAVFQGCGLLWLSTLCMFMCVSQGIYKNHSHLSSVAGGPTLYYVICDLEKAPSTK